MTIDIHLHHRVQTVRGRQRHRYRRQCSNGKICVLRMWRYHETFHYRVSDIAARCETVGTSRVSLATVGCWLGRWASRSPDHSETTTNTAILDRRLHCRVSDIAACETVGTTRFSLAIVGCWLCRQILRLPDHSEHTHKRFTAPLEYVRDHPGEQVHTQHNRFTAGLEYVRVHPGQQVPKR